MTIASLTRDRLIGLGVLALLVLGWQLLSVAFPQEIVPGVPMVPGWEKVFTTTFVSISRYWPGGWGFGSVATGEQPGYFYALLAIIYHSSFTFLRLLVGLLIGSALGISLGLAVSWSAWGRRLVNLPMQFLRVLPLLALLPLFQVWFGLSFLGEVIFVGYGVGVIFFAATINAVSNVPDVYVENSRTFGASQWRTYRTVILPAILPELHSAVLLALGAAWSAVLGSEFLGAQSGLGYILVYSQAYGFLDRMFFIALLVVLFASGSFLIVNRLLGHATRWAR